MEAPQERSPEIDRLSQALTKAQGQIRDAERTSKNDFIGYNYADLTAVMATIRKPLAAHGLAVCQTFLPFEGKTHLVTTLLHESGQFLKGFMPLLGVKDHHSLGSATTYARRISLAALMGVCPQGDDDDGEQAMGESREAEKKTRTTPRKKAPAKKKEPGKDLQAKCQIIIDQVDGAENYLRGKEIDPGNLPPNIRDKILALGPDGFTKKLEEQRKAEEAEEIIDQADKVEPVKDDKEAAA